MAEKQYTTFRLDNDTFGMDILLVREINRSLQITPVEQAPDFVTGLLNLRGQIITVIDLGVRLGLEKRELTAQSRCIVLKTTQELQARHVSTALVSGAPTDFVGLLVDSVSDMVTIDDADILPPPANLGQVSDKFLTGVIRLESTLVGLIDVTKILHAQS